MIATLRGSLQELGEDWVVISIGGIVGVVVMVPESEVAKLRKLGERTPGVVVGFSTHLHVREDALTLYGFEDAERRNLFRALLEVGGIGTKAALAVLSVLSVDAVRAAVLAQDPAPLVAVRGIGLKTAGRIVLKLEKYFAG